MRKRSVAILAAAAALGATVATAPAASAEPNPPNCPKGYVCAYSGPNQTGTQVIGAQGNWSGNVAARSVFNNGHVYPGADHIQLNTVWSSGSRWTICLHYNPGPGTYKVNLIPGERVTSMTWRGECSVEGWQPR
ncbi:MULTISPECIES: peptidase inhibitor family I36 protein [Streptomyces]|uniref:peptidase inhibitor family I36 protein n=1 Tax=Streptomyces TaxID=1883 RepID=UPI00037F8077|nr:MULTISPECIES: peptidase inhibitor family I36 protein [Streptomyces]